MLKNGDEEWMTHEVGESHAAHLLPLLTDNPAALLAEVPRRPKIFIHLGYQHSRIGSVHATRLDSQSTQPTLDSQFRCHRKLPSVSI